MKTSDLYKFVVENSIYTVFLFERNKMVFASGEMQKFSKSTKEEIKSVTLDQFFEFIHPDDLARIKIRFEEGRRDKTSSTEDIVRVKDNNGSYLWLKFKSFRFFDENGRLENLLIYSHDVTDIMTKENLIRRRLDVEKAISKITSLLFKDNPDAVNLALKTILDISKACRVYIFRNFEDETGDLCLKQINEVCALDVHPEIDNSELQHFSYIKQGFERWRKKLEKGEMIIGDVHNFPMEERDVLVSQDVKSLLALPIFTNNEWFGFVGLDFTKRHAIFNESDLRILHAAADLLGAYFRNAININIIKRNNADLKRLNEDKDRFVQILAHDLKNPFNSLINISEILNTQYDNFDKNEVKNHLSALNEISWNTYNLLSDLLMWSGARTGKVSVKLVKVDLIKKIEVINKEFKHLIDKKEIHLSYEGEPMCLAVDANMIKTILRNLYSNAVKFTPSGGNIYVRWNKNEAGDEAIIEIQDTGIGMSEDEVKKLWNRSVPFTKKGTDGEDGSGLGILLCTELVEKHGCRIWLESEKGVGTTFYFSMPIWQDQEEC